MFSLRVSTAKWLGLYLKSIRERYGLSSQYCGLDALMLLQLGVASPNLFCLSIHPVLCFRFLRLHQQIHWGYMNSLSECVKCYVVQQHACVIFVALLSCKYMRKDNSFGIHLCSPLTDHCFWLILLKLPHFMLDFCWLKVLYTG